ncbi:alpha/beta fold hydrolase [Flavobacterium agrisoli]|uniref:Alpha/beta hydrolase n=1 Tax=Flavobacterium agrisoli TaxID=2793066 RepID=A0A934PHQ8_9FLAO|nr:alpha/beta hydrolase [Flavobacterium agrisoli]MBK0368321.1 alpha/beta hydrolase [Flavobacterium agrisoli]
MHLHSNKTIIRLMNTKKIFFISGAFINSNSWDYWKTFFQSKGYEVIIPVWPAKEGTVQELRKKHPDAILGKLSLEALVKFYIELLRKEEEKPIAIGHSVGGLIVQLLLQENLLFMGIAIHSVPPKGITNLEFSFYKALWKSIGIFKSKKIPHLMSLKEWQYAFTNTMSLKDQKDAYDTYLIPESRRIIRGLFTNTAKVDYSKKKYPLLFIAGSKDNMMPANLNFKNYKMYQYSPSITDYKEFEGINHFVISGKKWSQTAAYVLNWIKQHRG